MANRYGNGFNGAVQGVLGSFDVGQRMGDAFARKRASGRMDDLQSRLDSGEFGDPNDPATQLRIQQAVREAQQPLDSRGLADDGGDAQYARLMRLQQLRADQAAGGRINTGDLAGGVMDSSIQAAALGNLPAALRSRQLSGQMQAGADAVTTGANGQPTVDQHALAQGVAVNNARSGDAAGAAQWGSQEKAQGNAAMQGMAGRALSVAMGPGGLKEAVPYLHSLAKMAGYPDVQWDEKNQQAFVMEPNGQSGIPITQQNLLSFVKNYGTDPEVILGAIRATEAKQADDQRNQGTADHNAFRDAGLAAAREFTDAGVGGAGTSGSAVAAVQRAAAAGWKQQPGDPQDFKNADGEVVGKQYLYQAPSGGPLVSVVVSTEDGPGKGGYRVLDANGRPLDPRALSGVAAGGIELAAQAAQAQAMAANQAFNQDRWRATMGRFADVSGMMSGKPAMGPAQGTHPALQTPSAGAPGPTMSPQTLLNYQSPYERLDVPQAQAESGNNQSAVSPAGARGVMQLMGPTATQLETQFQLPAGTLTANTPQAAKLNTLAGRVFRDQLITSYRKAVKDPYMGVALGLIAYNWGPSNTDKWIAGGMNPAQLPKETRNYVNQVMGGTRIKHGSGMMPSAPTAAAAPATVQRAAPPSLPNGAMADLIYKG
jgi:hypothetical protein